MIIEPIKLIDDGLIPNNPRLPLLLYRDWLGRPETTLDARAVLALFARHGWGGGWVNGIFPFHHYHARSHEVLANAGDAVDVQFGGERGPILTFEHGSAVVIPAGCGHCRVSEPGRLVIAGAYPAGQENWDLKRAGGADYILAKTEIPRVPRPSTDPLLGSTGGINDYWP